MLTILKELPDEFYVHKHSSVRYLRFHQRDEQFIRQICTSDPSCAFFSQKGGHDCPEIWYCGPVLNVIGPV
jgi:hypothetical protein